VLRLVAMGGPDFSVREVQAMQQQLLGDVANHASMHMHDENVVPFVHQLLSRGLLFQPQSLSLVRGGDSTSQPLLKIAEQAVMEEVRAEVSQLDGPRGAVALATASRMRLLVHPRHHQEQVRAQMYSTYTVFVWRYCTFVPADRWLIRGGRARRRGLRDEAGAAPGAGGSRGGGDERPQGVRHAVRAAAGAACGRGQHGRALCLAGQVSGQMYSGQMYSTYTVFVWRYCTFVWVAGQAGLRPHT
jgi:hypothetical protein